MSIVKDLLVISTTDGLSAALSGYAGARLLSGADLRFGQRMALSGQPPEGLYLEDSCGTVADLWAAIRAAQAAQIPVCVGLWGPGRSERDDLASAGIAVAPDEARGDAQALAGWLAGQWGLSARAARGGQVRLAVSGAKGGIGKTLLTVLLAESLHRRGLRVLIVDGDVSNSGLVPTFRIAGGAPSYLHLRGEGPGAWTPDNLRGVIHRHARSGLSLLLGSEETADSQDITWHEWQAMLQAVAGLDEYDVALIDTGPEIKRRPYALDVLQHGGYAVLPVHPGRKERAGAGNALQFIAAHGSELLARCLLVLMEPERGAAVSVEQVAPRFAQLFPSAQLAGRLPRAPFLVSRADEEGDTYLSPLDLQPYGAFSRATHELADRIARLTGMQPPLPVPRGTLMQRLLGSRATRTPDEALRRPAVIGR